MGELGTSMMVLMSLWANSIIAAVIMFRIDVDIVNNTTAQFDGFIQYFHMRTALIQGKYICCAHGNIGKRQIEVPLKLINVFIVPEKF